MKKLARTAVTAIMIVKITDLREVIIGFVLVEITLRTPTLRSSTRLFWRGRSSFGSPFGSLGGLFGLGSLFGCRGFGRRGGVGQLVLQVVLLLGRVLRLLFEPNRAVNAIPEVCDGFLGIIIFTTIIMKDVFLKCFGMSHIFQQHAPASLF